MRWEEVSLLYVLDLFRGVFESNQVSHRRARQGNRTKGYHYYEGRVYKSKV